MRDPLHRTLGPGLLALPLVLCACSSGGDGDDPAPDAALPSYALIHAQESSGAPWGLYFLDLVTDERVALTESLLPGHDLDVGRTRVAPDGSSVAVVVEDGGTIETHVIDVAARTAREVVSLSNLTAPAPNRGGPFPPELSYAPDSSALLAAYVGSGGSVNQLRMLDVDGTNDRVVLPTGTTGTLAAWLPDGSGFVTIETDAVNGTRVVVRSTATLAEIAASPDVGIAGGPTATAVSADSSTVACVWWQAVLGAPESSLAIFDAQGGTSEIHASIFGPVSGGCLAISDDGSRVALRTDAASTSPEQLHIAEFGQNTIAVWNDAPTDSTAQISTLRWQTGGDTLAYVADHRVLGAHEVWVTETGGTVRPVATAVPAASTVEDLAWNADGSWLAYVRDEGAPEDDQLYAYAPSQATEPLLQSVTSGSTSIQSFLWSPDGETLIALEDSGLSGGEVRTFKLTPPTAQQSFGAGWGTGYFASHAVGPDAPSARVAVRARADGTQDLLWFEFDNAPGFRRVHSATLGDPASLRDLRFTDGGFVLESVSRIFLR